MRLLPLVALCATLLTSCLEIEQTVTLSPDGSGTQKMKLAMTERSLAAARSQVAVGAAAVDPSLVFDAKLVRQEVVDAGLVCESATTSAQRRRQILEVEARFAGIEALRKSPLSGAGAEWEFAAGERPGTIRAVFYPRGRKAWEAAREKAAAISTDPNDRAQTYFKRAKGEMRGLKVKWTLDLPGDVVACSKNLVKSGDRRVIATITDAAIRSPRDLVLQLAPRFEVVFDGKGCTFLR